MSRSDLEKKIMNKKNLLEVYSIVLKLARPDKCTRLIESMTYPDAMV